MATTPTIMPHTRQSDLFVACCRLCVAARCRMMHRVASRLYTTKYTRFRPCTYVTTFQAHRRNCCYIKQIDASGQAV